MKLESITIKRRKQYPHKQRVVQFTIRNACTLEERAMKRAVVSTTQRVLHIENHLEEVDMKGIGTTAPVKVQMKQIRETSATPHFKAKIQWKSYG